MSSISDFFVLLGSFFFFCAALGVVRMGDFFQRIQVTGLASTLGAVLFFVGLMLKGANPWKLSFLLLFFFLTGPLVAHLLGRGAFRSKGRISNKTALDPRLKRR